MKYNFDVSTLEGLEKTFDKAKETLTDWEWTHGGYESLYNSNKRRLIKEKIIRDAEYAKNNTNKRAKK
jgi:hypothetical protein